MPGEWAHKGFLAQSFQSRGRRLLLPREPPESALRNVCDAAIRGAGAAAVAAGYCGWPRCYYSPLVACTVPSFSFSAAGNWHSPA